MSYILEALRRSQAERERGHVPGLHAQPVAAETIDDAQRAAPPAWAIWLAAGAGVLALVALLLLWARPQPALVAPVAAPAVAAPAATPAPAVVMTPNASPSPAPSPTPSPSAAPVPPPSLPIVVSAPPVAVAPVQAVPTTASTPATTPPTTPPTTSASIPLGITPVIAAPRNARVPTVAELSAEQRRELPPLVLGGSVWSDNAASRFVIFNGQIVHEGQPAAPGVVVERIAAKAVQLRWRGQLFEVAL